MNYKKIHNSIIERALKENRVKNKEKYYELHHIIPKSLGGSNQKDNLVLLTPREHFIIHKCLVLIYLKEQNKNAYHKMMFALNRFLKSKNSKDYKIKSRDYENIRLTNNKSLSEVSKGKQKSVETKVNMSSAQRKRFENSPGNFTGKTHSDETKKLMSLKQSGSNNPRYGKPKPIEEREKISKSMKGKPKSPETVEKFRNRTQSKESRKRISESIKQWHANRNKDFKVAK